MAMLQTTPLLALEDYVQALFAALEDARAYRLGEHDNVDDPDLDLDDRQHLLRYEDLERQLRMVVDECTRCGHRHLVVCDGVQVDRDPEGDSALVHCGCPEPETAADLARLAEHLASEPSSDPWHQPALPHHTDPRCPELFAVTPGRDTCTCRRPRPDEPPF